MKTWITQTVAGLFALAATSLTACKKDEVQATLTPSNSPSLTASTNAVVLTQANAANNAVTYTWTPITSFVWTEAEHSYNPTVVYTLQIDKQGNNFAAAVSTDLSARALTLTVGDLNTKLTTLGITPGTATPLEVRVKATYAANAPLYSPTVALTATTYKACVPPTGSATWSIIGPAGVDWGTDIPLTYNCDTKTFDVTRALNAGDFKFRANNDWTLNYGSNSNTGGALVASGNNITVATAGTYTIKLNLSSMTYSIR